jgi:hypothetical protein
MTTEVNMTTRGSTTAIAMLVGAAGAGALIWFAGRFDNATSHDYWLGTLLAAAAGLVVGISLRAGRMALAGLVVALLAVLAAAWVSLADQPTGGHVHQWSHDLGIGGVTSDLGVHVGVLVFGAAVLLGSAMQFVPRRSHVQAVAEPEQPTVVEDERLEEPSVRAVS